MAQCLLSFDFRSTLPIEKEKEKTKVDFFYFLIFLKE